LSGNSYKIGAVPYLNAEPLVWPLEKKIIDHPHTLIKAEPSLLVKMLSTGEVDAAIAPVAAMIEHPGLVSIPDIAIACRGPVASVICFHNDPFTKLEKIYLDPASRTSNLLVQILRTQMSDKPCRFIMPEDEPPSLANLPSMSGRLIIGDPALSYASEKSGSTGMSDLGQLWKEMTNLPFTFARWIARDGFIAGELTSLLKEVRDWSILNLHTLIEPLAERYDFRPDLVDRYLRLNITYMFGPREQNGEQEFFRLAKNIVTEVNAD
jgi:predicted solute-binding protein